jgi:eukaryotic-like serine/threonine-protein kinase
LLGRTPLQEVSLPRGSYLLRVREAGHAELRYPVHLGRGESLRVARPGDLDLLPLPLLREDEIEPDQVYVPAGWFAAGGDPTAGEALPAQRVWVDGFLLDRHPVTVGGYLELLDDLVATGREAEAEAACPCLPSSYAGAAKIPLLARAAGGRYLPPPEGSLRWPVASITWHAAMAYTSWRAARSGLPWRLPSELEREKAARGADGRFLPWGDQPEPTWACMVGSRSGVPALASVDEYETDESPYGARGLAGNVRDWCVEVWMPGGPPIEGGALRVTPAALSDPGMRSIRGGAFYAPPQLCRAAVRFAAPPGDHIAGVGLRLARVITCRG